MEDMEIIKLLSPPVHRVLAAFQAQLTELHRRLNEVQRYKQTDKRYDCE